MAIKSGISTYSVNANDERLVRDDLDARVVHTMERIPWERCTGAGEVMVGRFVLEGVRGCKGLIFCLGRPAPRRAPPSRAQEIQQRFQGSKSVIG